MPVKPELVTTEDGSHTLYIPEINEHYHSIHGAITESRHVFIEAGLKQIEDSNIEIFEMGFGTGLNAMLTLEEAMRGGRHIVYSALEKYPLGNEITGSLNYGKLLSPSAGKHFMALHECAWQQAKSVTNNFTLFKIRGDLLDLDTRDRYDLVYFDAFAPDRQPELWTTGIFTRIHRSMKRGAILTTYSAKGQVRRNMTDAGFHVEKLPGPIGKREMIRARED
jgi:tRNA U34 5-methylaminomethyl-2-thiouridine-forming methyltransferase MnmC